MCGIVGVFGKNMSESKLQEMLSVQEHRGPDNSGTFLAEGVAIGHNRLSIIDLSEAANQPYFSNDQRFVLAFNGEIYNYLELKKELQYDYDFKTASDTEVLMAAYLKWGKDCLHRLNGMFAFLIWDTHEQYLFVARDRFGVKPLYYSYYDNALYVSSEIKTIFSSGIPRSVNEKVWANYFVNGSYGLPNETFWQSINQLPGGHYLEYVSQKIRTKQWYSFESRISHQPKGLSFSEAKHRYHELLKDSIRLRFRTDVPIGFNVSGGLDSSLLLSLVNSVEEGLNINAYTFYTGNEDYDELPWVKSLLACTNNPLNEVSFTYDVVETYCQQISHYQDEPFGGIPTLAYAKIFQTASMQGIKVLLDGQGMDEQWAGYDYYNNSSNNVIQGVNSSPFRPHFLIKDFRDLTHKSSYPTPFNNKVQNLQFRDLFYTKIPRALRFNDRISMAYSTELREPFLDYRLVEFAFSQPTEFKIKEGVHKFLPRTLAKDFLPDNISFAPKRPLQTPQREWLGNELRSWVIDSVKTLKTVSWIDMSAVERELDNYFRGEQDSSFHIWQLINSSLLLS